MNQKELAERIAASEWAVRQWVGDGLLEGSGGGRQGAPRLFDDVAVERARVIRSLAARGKTTMEIREILGMAPVATDSDKEFLSAVLGIERENEARLHAAHALHSAGVPIEMIERLFAKQNVGWKPSREQAAADAKRLGLPPGEVFEELATRSLGLMARESIAKGEAYTRILRENPDLAAAYRRATVAGIDRRRS